MPGAAGVRVHVHRAITRNLGTHISINILIYNLTETGSVTAVGRGQPGYGALWCSGLAPGAAGPDPGGCCSSQQRDSAERQLFQQQAQNSVCMECTQAGQTGRERGHTTDPGRLTRGFRPGVFRLLARRRESRELQWAPGAARMGLHRHAQQVCGQQNTPNPIKTWKQYMYIPLPPLPVHSAIGIRRR